MKNKSIKILLIVIGAVSIALSIRCFAKYTGQYSEYVTYGGDAYTGIQNAAAETANNVKEMNKIISFGFGSVLLVIGASMLGIGIISYRDTTSESNSDTNTNNEENIKADTGKLKRNNLTEAIDSNCSHSDNL